MLVMIIPRYPFLILCTPRGNSSLPCFPNDIYVSDSYASSPKLWTSLIRCPIDIPTYLKGIPYISCLGPQQKKRIFFLKKGKSNMLSPFSQLKTNTIHKSLNNLATVFSLQPHLISHCTFSLCFKDTNHITLLFASHTPSCHGSSYLICHSSTQSPLVNWYSSSDPRPQVTSEPSTSQTKL